MTTNDLLHEPGACWSSSFVLDDVTYLCKEAEANPVHRMGGILMDLGREEYVSSDGVGNIIVLPRNRKSATISYSILSIDKYAVASTDVPIVVAIYRKGERCPIHYREYDNVKEDLMDSVSDYEVLPGEYILITGNIAPYDHLLEKFEKAGNFYVLHMRVVEHGENIKHPILLNADIGKDRDITLSFHYSMDISGELIECECYDDDYRLVAETEMYVPSGIFSNDVCLKLKEKIWWLYGGYHLIVYHNHEPFAYIRFFTEEETNEVTHMDTLPHDNVLYKLCKDVNCSGHKHMFCLLNGCGHLKRRVLDYLCCKHGHVNEHLMFAASGEPEYEVMHTITGLLHPKYGYRAVTVEKLMNEVTTVPDSQEVLDVKLARHSTVLYGLENLTDPVNEGFARMLLKVAADRHGTIALYGTPAELKRLLEIYPEWKEYLLEASPWTVYNYSERDAVRIAEYLLKKKNLTVNWAARKKLLTVLGNHWDTLRFWNKADYIQWVETEIMSRIKQRIFSENSFSPKFMQTVLEEDISLTLKKEHAPESFGYSLTGLERMVGLTVVKNHLKLLLKRMDFDRKREKLGLCKLETGRPHMVFTGNPGTGKTTVAKLVGQAFKHLGYLSGGDVIAVERSQLVGRHIGETENRMTQLLKKAKGHVLFIDEAYSLCDNNEGDRKDFGCRALECLLPILADADSDIIVILAGYEKEMEEMMNLNPGMRGRFPFWFKFEDYNPAELHEIAVRLLEDNDYCLTEDASKKLECCIAEAVKVKGRFFHNARWVNQLVQDGILAMMAERLYETAADIINLSLFRTVTEADVSRGYELTRADKKNPPKRKMGFR